MPMSKAGTCNGRTNDVLTWAENLRAAFRIGRPCLAGQTRQTGLTCISLGPRRDSGYTLIELMFVIFIIAMILSIAMPKLMPAMMSSQLEGQARHLANYGRSAIAYSALHREPITVRFDLANHQYYCLKWSEEDLALKSGMESAGLSGIDGKNNMGLTRDPNKQANGLSTNPSSQMSIQDVMDTGTAEDLEYQRDQVLYELDMMFRRSLVTQSENVPREDQLGVNPMLQKKFSLATNDQQEQRDELQDSMLEHVALPEPIVVESVMLGGEVFSEGVVDVEIAPLGLSQTVSFVLKGERNEYLTVQWDPITGGAHMVRGKEMANAGPGF